MPQANPQERRQPDRRIEDPPNREINRLMNLLLSRFEVDHWRWHVASKSLKIWHRAIGCHP
jgi:hypothetical protein